MRIRKVFKVDVGNLPKDKAEKYLRSIENKITEWRKDPDDSVLVLPSEGIEIELIPFE